MAIKTFSTLAAYDAAKATLTAADTVTIKDNTLTAADVAALGADPLVDAIRVSPLSLKIDQFTAAQAKLNALDKITVSDTAALINTNLATLLANAKVDSIAATGGPIQLTVAQAGISTNLAKIPAGSVVSVVDTSANIQSKLAALFSNAKITYINSSEDGVALTLTPAQATNPANIFKLQTADKIVVSGVNTAIQPSLSALLAIAKVDSIISDSGVLVLTAAQATTANLSKLNGTSSISVMDTTAAIQSKLVALLASAKVDFINSTENAVALKLTAAQAVTAIDAGSLVKIQGTDRLVVADSSANIQANLTKLLANAKIDAIDSNQNLVAINLTAAQAANTAKLQLADNLAVVDTGANIQAKLAALLANPKIDSISTSDASALTLKAAAAVADSAAKIQGTIAVSDTSAAINANLDALLADAKVTSINSTQDTTAITLTAAQALVAANLDKLQTADNVVVALSASDNLTADQITALNALVGGKVDSIQNDFSFTATTDPLVAEGNGISFTVTSLVPVAADTTFTYSIQGNGTNPTIASDLTPTSGTVKILAGQSTANFTVNAINEGVAEFDEGAIVTLKNGTAVVGTQAFTVTDGASYTLTGPASATDEGSTATFTLNTVNVADDTVLTYTLSGTNIDASDIVGGSLTGTTTVTGGVATIDVQLAGDLKTEGAETLKLTVEGKTANAVVNDTSLDATYTLVADQATANEGTNATFSLTSNAPAGSVVNYTLSGVTATDVTGGLLTGQVTLGAGGTATITVPLALDMLTEATPETLTVTVADQTASTIVVDKSFTPTLVNDTFQVVPGAAGSVAALIAKASLLANDIDSTGAVLTGVVSIVPGSEVNGTTVLNSAGDILFTPDAGKTTGSFQYSVDGVTGTATANVIFNTTPVATAGSAAVTEGTQATGAVAGTDADAGQTLTYTLVTGPTKGTLGAIDPATGAFTYDYTGAAGAVKGALAAGATDTDSFTFKVTDNLGKESVEQTFTLTTTGINDSPAVVTPAPVAIDVHSGQGTGTGTGATPVSVDLSAYATDPDAAAGALTYALVGSTTAHGGTVTLVGNTATITYPQAGGAGALGADTISFTVTDGLIVTPVSATVNLNVTNTAPVANDVALGAKTGVTQTIDLVAGTSTQGSTVTTFTSGVSDADSNTVTPVIVAGSLSNGGSAEVINGKIVYTSTVGYTGTETLKYTLTDGFGGTSAEHTLTFTVASNTGGTSGNDLLYGSTAAENIDGLAGDDTIVGGGGLDTLIGGDGNDTVTFSDAASQILGGAGLDTLVITGNALAGAFNLNSATQQNIDANSKNSQNTAAVVRTFENMDASKSSNAIILNATSDGITTTGVTNADARAGGDTANTTSILSGSSNDTLYFTHATGTVTVAGNGGNDTIIVDNVQGGSHDEQKNGTGTVIVPTASGKFSIDGGDGNDSIDVRDTSVVHTLLGGAGNDTIYGGSGASSIDGGAGNDSVTGGAGSEMLLGGDGDDTIISGGGTDTINGGAGTDIMSVATNVTDTAFTNVSGIETLQVTGANNVTLAANIVPTTIDVSAAGDAIVTFNSGYTSATTVNLGVTDRVVNTANVALTMTATAANMISGADVSITGGTGTDTLNLTADSSAALTLASITSLDAITIVDGGDATSGSTNLAGSDVSITLAAGYATNLTVNAAALDAGTLTSAGAMDLYWENLNFDGTLQSTATTVLNVTGGAGADTIKGGAGNDIISGGAGNDTIDVGTAAGNDSVAGGDGNDTISMGAVLTSADTIDGGAGTDTMSVSGTALAASALTNISNVENLVLTGGGSGATLSANLSFTTIDMNNGSADNTAQTLTLSTGYTNATTVSVDAGDKVVNTANVALTVNATAADLQAADVTTITGGTGADVLNITADAEAPTGAAVVSLAGLVTLVDTINIIDGGNTTTTIGKDVSITTGAYNTALTINGTALSAGTLDTATPPAPNVDWENLTVDGTSALKALTITTGSGINNITGGTAGDSITGGSGNDSINGAAGGNDTIITGNGTNTINMQGALTYEDTITGGTGVDTLITSTAITDFQFFKTTGVDTLTLGSTATLANFATAAGISKVNVSGASAVDATGMTTGVNFVGPTGVNNTSIAGGTGADTFTYAGTTLDGSDSINGGNGTDTISLDNSAGTVTASVDLNLTFVTKVENYTVLNANGGDTAGAENADPVSLTFATATSDAIAIVSNVSAAVITDANDTFTVDASAISDTDFTFSITGGAGNDILTGAASADTINGSTGLDTITGGLGADNLTGGAGADVFAYTAATQSTLAGADTITDFVTGTDVIRFTTATSVANSLTYDYTNKGTALNNADALVLLSGSGAADQGTNRVGQYYFNTTTGQMIMDADGNGLIQSTDFAATLTGKTSVAAGDVNFAITAGAAIDQAITTGGGADTINISAVTGLATVNGGAGNDTITANTNLLATDSIIGGDGTDTLLTSSTSVALTTDANLATLENITLTADATTLSLLGQTEAFNVTTANGTNSVTLGSGASSVTGGTGADTIVVASHTVLSGLATVAGGTGDDILSVSTADLGIVDSDFARMSSVKTLSLTGASTAVLGSSATTAGIDTVVTGTGNTSITSTQTADTVTATAINGTLTLAGSSNYTVAAGVTATAVTATTATGTLAVTYADLTASASTLTTGTGATSVTTTLGTASDTITVAAAALAQNTALTLNPTAGAAGSIVNVTGLVGNLVATNHTSGGAITVTTADAADNGISLTTGATAFKANISAGAGSDTVGIVATALANNTALTINDAGAAAAGTVNVSGLVGDLVLTNATSGTIGVAAVDNTADSGIAITGPAGTTALNVTAVADGDTVTVTALTSTGAFTGAIAGTTGKFNVTGGAGVQTITTAAGADTITGGAAIDAITGGAGADNFVFKVVTAADADNIVDFTVAQTDVLAFSVASMGLNAGDYAAGAVTIVTAAAATALAAGAASNNIIVDTAANIAGMVDADAAWTGGAIAIASDTGSIYWDADSDFSAASEIIGSITAAQAALLANGNLSIIA